VSTLVVNVTKNDILEGVRSSPGWCPIALAVRRRTKAADVNVGTMSADVGKRTYLVPAETRQFIIAFDMKQFVKPGRYKLISK